MGTVCSPKNCQWPPLELLQFLRHISVLAATCVYCGCGDQRRKHLHAMTCGCCCRASNNVWTCRKTVTRRRAAQDLQLGVKTCTVVNTAFSYNIFLLITKHQMGMRHSSIPWRLSLLNCRNVGRNWNRKEISTLRR